MKAEWQVILGLSLSLCVCRTISSNNQMAAHFVEALYAFLFKKRLRGSKMSLQFNLHIGLLYGNKIRY